MDAEISYIIPILNIGGYEMVTSKNKESYKALKEKLFIRIEPESLEAKSVPHEKREDLYLTAHILQAYEAGEIDSYRVTYSLLKDIGIAEEEMFRDAMINSEKILPMSTAWLSSLLFGGDTEEMNNLNRPHMLVVSNEKGIYGSSALFYQDTLKKLFILFRQGFYILPASIHELILLPEKEASDYQELENMVKDINMTKVAEEDFLSDNVYYYSSNLDTIIKASDHCN